MTTLTEERTAAREIEDRYQKNVDSLVSALKEREDIPPSEIAQICSLLVGDCKCQTYQLPDGQIYPTDRGDWCPDCSEGAELASLHGINLIV